MENPLIESTRGGIRSMRKPDGQTLLLGSVIVGAIGLLGYLLAFDHKATSVSRSQPSARLTLANIPFDGQRAYRWLSDLCAIGRRPSGSPGMGEPTPDMEPYDVLLLKQDGSTEVYASYP